MGLQALFKKYPIFLMLVLVAMASCQSFHLRSSGPVSPDDREQQQLAREFKKLEKQAAKQAGWSEKRKLKEARRGENQKIEKVISTARSYYGTPYKYGGTTRIGIDCSGLLYQSFSAIDVQLPRSSNEQSQLGPSVRPKELQKGDLVFFSARRGSSQITHVGLVTEVIKEKEEVRFIHSSTSLGVKEDNVFSSYWSDLFIKAVRPQI
ncbi:C40 family peptidase [Adhaeribacter terrigena]|nr:C40 family peptidase [Adhaeribacter terrigena]